MAVVKIPGKCSMQLVVQTGVNATGKPTTATRTYSNINRATTDDVLFDVFTRLAGLQKHTLTDIKRVDTSALINE